MSWSAGQYAAFERERTRPARDLLAGVASATVRIAVDLGCGPGNSTELIAARFPHARITGIDSSPDMIAAARARLPTLDFQIADIRAWAAASMVEPADLIFTNAALQWVPGHAGLFAALAVKLERQGSLAVQMPDNLAEPAQTLMREVGDDERWRDRLAAARTAREPIAAPECYHRWLKAHCSHVDVWRTTYYHPLAGAGAIVEWFKGTGLLPFLSPLEPSERASYLERYGQAVASAYPAAADGTVWLPLPRLFIVARR